MELLILAIIIFFALPIMLSIIALVKANNMSNEIKRLREAVQMMHELQGPKLGTKPPVPSPYAPKQTVVASEEPKVTPSAPLKKVIPASTPPAPPAPEPPVPPAPKPPVPPAPEPPVPPAPKPPVPPALDTMVTAKAAVPPKLSTPAPKPITPSATDTAAAKAERAAKTKAGMEFLMGGKAAAFAGIAILVIGIVLLVGGYAIENSILGPGLRVTIGLLAGVMFVVGGHLVGRKDDKMRLFSRVVTGGGCALFYFSVFAAYGIFHLIGPFIAAVGLFIAAMAVFALAMYYKSEAVGVLGVLGAFLTPLLLSNDMDDGVFPLLYVAVVNAPVILLGVHRRWQILYNLSFVLTILYYIGWVDWGTGEACARGITFGLIYYFEYVALGMLKLRKEQQLTGRRIDSVRLVISSSLLMLALYWLLRNAGQQDHTGYVFAGMAVIHGLLALAAFKLLNKFKDELLAYIAGGVGFAALALPLQLDGVWVSLGWAIEGAVLAWFAYRVRSRMIQVASLFLGLLGIIKALAFDFTFYTAMPNAFFNQRFVVGIFAAILMGSQGWFASKVPDDDQSKKWQDTAWWIAILSIVLYFLADAFGNMDCNHAFTWFITSAMLAVVGCAVLLFVPKNSTATLLGSALLLLAPAKMIILDSLLRMPMANIILDMPHAPSPFTASTLWITAGQLLLLVTLRWCMEPRLLLRDIQLIVPANLYQQGFNLLLKIAFIVIISAELMLPARGIRMEYTLIFWGLSSTVLLATGLMRKSDLHHFAGLLLMLLTALALPGFIDGPWVSLGWTLLAFQLAWFGSCTTFQLAALGAMALNFVSLFKLLVVDATYYSFPPALFVNTRFIIAVLASLSFLPQKALADFPNKTALKQLREALLCSSVLMVLLFVLFELYWIIGERSPWSWLLTSATLIFTASALLLFAKRESILIQLGSLLMLAAPAKLLIDAACCSDSAVGGSTPFAQSFVWLNIAMVAAALCLLPQRIKKRDLPYPYRLFPQAVNVLFIAAGITILTFEFLRGHHPLMDGFVTALWGACALALIVFGMKRRSALHRYLGLGLIIASMIKVLLFDSSNLVGFAKIAAFIGTGTFLLALSVAYQKASAYFTDKNLNERDE